MKSNKPNPDLEQDEDESVEVEAKGPNIAAGKKSKMALIAGSSVFITAVIYFMFFKGESPETEKLQEVVTPPTSIVARSVDGKSPFELDAPKEASPENSELLAKPAAPEVPSLPSLPSGMEVDDQQPLIPMNAQQENQITNPQQVQQVHQFQNQVGNQQANQQVEAKKPKEADPRYSPIVVFSGGSVSTIDANGNAVSNSTSLGVGYENNIVNLNQDPIDKLERSKVDVKTTYVGDRVHAITQGKLLTAVLETSINTEIPGSVRAIVSRDVYGESGNEVLIPKGSRLYGAYSSQISRGQGRVNIGWSRLIRPDGVDMAITFNASDQFGRSGIEGDVNNKYGSVIANSLLTSVLAVGGVIAAQKAIGNSANTTSTTTAGVTTTTGNASAQAVADVSKTIVDTVGTIIGNTLDLQPIIRVPQGTKITVIVNADMNLPSISKR